mmetsp:Transcript_73880/g.119903  ORF Transcript_73880/g.119903 Transcript_73880/m.119903 type:complete len:237 (+) Transcript_73880:1151-1861(+)
MHSPVTRPSCPANVITHDSPRSAALLLAAAAAVGLRWAAACGSEGARVISTLRLPGSLFFSGGTPCRTYIASSPIPMVRTLPTATLPCADCAAGARVVAALSPACLSSSPTASVRNVTPPPGASSTDLAVWAEVLPAIAKALSELCPSIPTALLLWRSLVASSSTPFLVCVLPPGIPKAVLEDAASALGPESSSNHPRMIISSPPVKSIEASGFMTAATTLPWWPWYKSLSEYSSG